jgi:hypothetical protein
MKQTLEFIDRQVHVLRVWCPLLLTVPAADVVV